MDTYHFRKQMSKFTTYWKNLPAEEKANTLTHVFPAIATLAIAWPLLRVAYSFQLSTFNFQLLGTLLFLLGMLLMFLSSTLYHTVTSPKHKARLRIFDHISIYVMIAGSYSLICMSVVGGWIGAIGKFVALGKHPKLSLALYLAMGWVALLILYPMWLHMSHAAFFWIIAEGVFYTIGSYFFNKDEEHAFYHAIWHVFITLGAASHTIATWLILS